MTPRGEFKDRVGFHRVTVAKNALGVEEPTVGAEIEPAMAKVLFGTGAERRQAGAEGASQTATFRVLSTAAIRTVVERDIIRFDGRDWNITSLAPIGREIDFTATVAKG